MQINVSEHFALLMTDRHPDTGKVLTRHCGVTTDLGHVLLGIDDEGHRHLLVPVSPNDSPDDRVSRGIRLGHRDLVVGSTVVRFADLTCTINRLTQTFDRLVEDILYRLLRDPRAGVSAVAAALDDWRALLRRSLEGLSRDEIIGLAGELDVMILLARVDPVAAVLDWTGPSGAVHDFSRGGHDIEVKATTAVNASRVRVSNLDQLDPALSVSLHLAVVHLTPGSNAPDIDSRIDTLLDLGAPADALEAKLADYGYVRGMDLDVPTAYTPREICWWEVTSDFPGLRRSDIDGTRLMAIDNVSYDLLLGVLPPALSADKIDNVTCMWAGGKQ